MSAIDNLSRMWVKAVIKTYPVKKIDMSLQRVFGLEGKCVIYTTRDSVKLTYLMVLRDETGELLLSNNDPFIQEQLQENLFNVESIIKDVIHRIALREYLLQQVEKELANVILPLTVDVKSRVLFHITATSIEQFRVDLKQEKVLDIRYLGKLSPERLRAIDILRQIGLTVWVGGESSLLLEKPDGYNE